ncbi:MAG TPA: DMT family transporter [Hyphomicrobiaceae bacterium]|jgi:drug/metabolite transporter (DMT)-like permease|nr:DMT family transporter [Hyphomicrobiaceae bacterium]
MPGLWAIFTVIAAGGQVLRNAQQKELTQSLGTVGATHVRFLFGLPFGLLFLVVVLAGTGLPLPHLSGAMLAWTIAAALAQIGATALLLAAMRDRSFVVITAYAKTEPLQVAVFGLAFLGDQVTPGVAVAIVIATGGVLLVSWPRSAGGDAFTWKPALLGIGSGAAFAIAAIGFRGGIRALDTPSFVMGATVTLALGLFIQTALLSGYLYLFDRKTLQAIFRLWRPSLFAGFTGAFASQMWYLAFALETAAKVRTLALVEILFAQVLSRNLFKQTLASREAAGIALIVAGVVLLLNA